MNHNKCAFIICTNSDFYYEECIAYIRHLHVPEGFETETIKIENAASMAAGYNEGMSKSDAKYKVYMHHDVYIYNQNFIEDMLKVFGQDEKIGMFGVVGGVQLPSDAVMWDAWNLGGTYGTDYQRVQRINFYQTPEQSIMEADALDGMFLVTQYDLPWREDLFDGWDFYDISQSMEFRKNGYKLVIPYQEDYWCMHDCGYSKLINYDKYREIFLEEYKEYYPGEFVSQAMPEFWNVQEEVFERFKILFDGGDYQNAFAIIQALEELYISDNRLRLARIFYDIWRNENSTENGGFFEGITNWEQAVAKYEILKFTLWDIERNHQNSRTEKLIEDVRQKKISSHVLAAVSVHVNVDCKGTLIKIRENLLK